MILEENYTKEESIIEANVNIALNLKKKKNEGTHYVKILCGHFWAFSLDPPSSDLAISSSLISGVSLFKGLYPNFYLNPTSFYEKLSFHEGRIFSS